MGSSNELKYPAGHLADSFKSPCRIHVRCLELRGSQHWPARSQQLRGPLPNLVLCDLLSYLHPSQACQNSSRHHSVCNILSEPFE